MNPEMPQRPQDELEASLTALLLGELPHDQAAALHQKLAQDAELSALYERLKHTIALVRETIATPAAQATTPLLPLRLEEQRRQKLLQHFKTVAPKEFAPPPRRSRRWLIPVGIAAGFVVLLGGLFLPALSRSKGGGPSLAFNTWSLSEKVQSRPPAEPLFGATEKHYRSGQDGRAEQRALGTESLRRAARVSASFDDSPSPAKSAGVAIVLPKGGKPDDADTAAIVNYSTQPEPAAPARSRAYYDDLSGRSGGGGGAGAYGGFAASTRGRAAAGADGQPTKGAIMDDLYSHQEALGVKESAAPVKGIEEALQFRERYAAPIVASSASSPASPPPQPSAKPTPPVASPVTRSLGEGQISVTSGKDLPSRPAAVPVPGEQPAGGVVAGAPVQLQVADRAAGDFVAGARLHAAGLPPAEVAKVTEALGRVDVAWSDVSKKALASDAPVVENRLNAAVDAKAAKEAQQGLAVLGFPAAGRPASQEQSFGLAMTQNQPAKAGERAGKSLNTSDFSIVNGNVPSLNYEWDGDATRQRGLATADGEKPPILGDVPMVRRFYRFGGGAGAGGASATPGAAYTPVPAQAQDGIVPNYSVMGDSLAERGVPADAEKNSKWFAKSASEEAPPPAMIGGRAQDELSAGAMRIKGEEKVKSVELAKKLDSVASGIENLGRPGRQQAEGEARKVMEREEARQVQPAEIGLLTQLKVEPPDAMPTEPTFGVGEGMMIHKAGTSTAWARSFTVGADVAKIAPGETTPTPRFDIALPAAQAETSLALKDSSGTDEKSRQASAAKRELDELQRLQSSTGGVKAPEERYAKLERQSGEAQKKVDNLRAQLQISDAMAGGEGPSPLLTADTLRKLEALRVETQAELSRQQTLLSQTEGTKLGQEAKVVALSKSLADLEDEVNKAIANDKVAAERVRPYFEAKRNLEELQRLQRATGTNQPDLAPAKPAAPAPAPVPQPEVQTGDNAFSTFSLNVSDVSFKLAAASLEKGVMPEPATVRSEEFINAFDYRDCEPPPGVPVAFAWERARYPFAQNRDLLRFSIKTAALGRQPGRPLNLVLLLDNSGSMERADRVRIIREALRVLAGQLQPQDKLSVVAFARTPRLFADGAPGTDAEAVALALSELTPQGGTNLEDAMDLAYQTARRHYLANGINRVVVLTDGAANLGNVEPDALKQKVEANRKQGIALDCFGIGWEGYNDDLLEVLSRNGDGRYGFINTPEEAATEFAGRLAGALKVAASDVKVQVEFNPARVTAYRQIGYAKHQLTKEQFRDNTVDAAEIGAAESGNALYVVEVNPRGSGALATVRVRYKVPGTTDYREQEWPVPYTGNAEALEQASPALRLAATASAFSEWLVSSPYAAEVTPDRLLGYLSGVPEVYGADARPKKLEWMLRQAKSIAGK